MTIERRLTHLENRCRFQSRLLVAVISIAALVVFLGAKALVAPQKLQVTALEVVDAKGNVRISLGDLKSEKYELFGVRLLDPTGKEPAVLSFPREEDWEAMLRERQKF